MKTYKQFSQELNEVAGAIRAVRGLSRVVRPSFKAVKNLISRPKPVASDYARMYHGTTEKAAKNILKTGMRGSSKNPVSSGVYDNSAIFKRRGFVTSDPEIARQYTMQHEYLGKKPDIVALKVLKKNLKKGTNPGEYTAPIKDIKPVARGVKPIETRKGQVMQDEFKYKTFKQFVEQWTPKGTFNKSPDKNSGLLDRIKSQQEIDLEKSEFKRVTGIPLVKKKSKKNIQTT